MALIVTCPITTAATVKRVLKYKRAIGNLTQSDSFATAESAEKAAEESE